MAYEEALQTITLVAAADLSAHQYKFVSVDSSGTVNLTGNDAKADGVLMNKPKSGEAGTVAIAGVAKVKCGAAVTRGGNVASGANGAAKNAATASEVLGVALETGASGRAISVLLQL